MMNLKKKSIQVIKSNQASTGAYIASPTFSQYGYSWLRDGMWIARSMDCVGEHESATQFHQWVGRTMMQYESHVNHLLDKLAKQQSVNETDYLPTRFTVDGKIGTDEWTDFQLDGYGAWLWGLVHHVKHYNADLWTEVYPAVQLTVRYLEALWQSPNYDCWEEFRNEIHIATLAALYGGLSAVHHFDPDLVSEILIEEIKAYTLHNGISAEGHFMKFLGNNHVDASLLWVAVPFELVGVTDDRFLATLQKIEQDIFRSGGGVYRYAADTYFGGGEWLLLTCWLAWVYIQQGRFDEAKTLIQWTEQQATADGEMPEQVSDHLLDASYYQYWVDRWGSPACPLLWSHAMYLIVTSELERHNHD